MTIHILTALNANRTCKHGLTLTAYTHMVFEIVFMSQWTVFQLYYTMSAWCGMNARSSVWSLIFKAFAVYISHFLGTIEHGILKKISNSGKRLKSSFRNIHELSTACTNSKKVYGTHAEAISKLTHQWQKCNFLFWVILYVHVFF